MHIALFSYDTDLLGVALADAIRAKVNPLIVRGPIHSIEFVKEIDEPSSPWTRDFFLGDDDDDSKFSKPELAVVLLPNADQLPDWAFPLQSTIRKKAPKIGIVWVLWDPMPFLSTLNLVVLHRPNEHSYLMNAQYPKRWPVARGKDRDETLTMIASMPDQTKNPFTGLCEIIRKYAG